MVVHEALVANYRGVVILRRDIEALFLIQARRSGMENKCRAVMGHRLAGPYSPAFVVVLVDDEGLALTGGVDEAGR